MRLWFVLAVAAITASVAFGQSTDSASSIGLDSVEFSTTGFYNLLNDTTFNKGNVLSLENWQLTPVATLAAHFGGLKLDASASVANYVDASPATPVNWQVNELYYSKSIGNYFRFFAGKHLVSWDTTPVFRPVDYFNTDYTDVNLENAVLPIQGRVGLGASVASQLTDLSFVMFDDRWASADVYNHRGGIDFGLKASGFFSPVSVSLASEAVWKQNQGVYFAGGGTVNWIPTNALQLYASASISRGSLEPIDNAALSSSPQVYSQNPVSDSRFDSSVLYPDIVAGVQWQFGPLASVYLAYNYDANKLDSTEWSRLMNAVSYHQGLNPSFVPASAIQANQVWDASFGTWVLKRQNHIAGTFVLNVGQFKLKATSIVSLADGSVLTQATGTWEVGPSLEVKVMTTWFLGPTDSEFGSYPIRAMFQTAFSYYID